MEILTSTDEMFVCVMNNMDASVANALRRILLNDVPSVAIEEVYILQNTSIMPDEQLSCRLGLVPLNVDADEMDFKTGEPTDLNTVVFRLEAKFPSSECKGRALKNVYSGDLQWVPQGGQAEKFVDERAIRPVHDDILLLKLAPGQEINIEAHAQKAVGLDHAKYSPVGTASYRQMPRVEIVSEISGARAEKLMQLMPGVFEIKKGKAVVVNPIACDMSYNWDRDTDLGPSLKVSRVPDQWIFTIESVGHIAPKTLFSRAIKLLAIKSQNMLLAVDNSD
jgi:DNA-directed RNA polymerase I and III subunit RPAC1